MSTSLLIVILLITSVIFIIIKIPKQTHEVHNGIEEWHDLGLIRDRYDSQEPDSGFVYFVRESGNYRIKIGKAKNPESRIDNDFGTLMPYEFETLHLIESMNYSKTEKLFHKYFSDKRYKGEWFDLTDNDLTWIKKEKFPREIEDSIKGY
jgi:hypothetical protein